MSDSEPQNALTKKFTEAEWRALKEFRAQLPATIREAFPIETPETVKLWGITIDSEAEVPNDARLVEQQHTTRELDINRAKEMFVSTLKWRTEFKADAIADEEFPQDVFGKLGHIYGRDKEGHLVTYNLYGGDQDLRAIFSDIPRFIRWRIALMEKGIAQLDFENVDQIVQVHDYDGVSLGSRDANSKKAASQATTIFQNFYPEFLHRKFFINVPALFTWIFWLFKPILSVQTLAKMSVVGTGPQTIGKELLLLIDAKELPKRYGGEADDF